MFRLGGIDSIASWILLKSPLPDWSTLIRIAVEKSMEDEEEEEEAMDEDVIVEKMKILIIMIW